MNSCSPNDYDDICREDYAFDAWLERVGDATVGYCKHCGGRVFLVEKNDESYLHCGKCGILDEDEVSEEEVEVE